jgi:2-(1,2-epoxy-1,2-dihydrophenyl)acetyl-CoA isomerase
MSDIIFERQGGVATVTLNRPAARNAVTGAMVQDFTRFVRSVERDTSLRCIVLRGEGDHFMAGGDVKSFGETAALPGDERRAMFEQRVQDVSPLLLALERMPQILVAGVKGAVAGAGLSFVAGADLAIAGASSFFLLAQIKIGVSPDGGATYYLPRELGLKRAKEIALLGDRFDAAQAQQWGLVNRVVPDAEVAGAVTEIAQRLAAGPSLALARTKRLIQRSLHCSLPEQLQAEAEAFADCASQPDFVEGATAFAERRSPRFGGSTQ